MKSIFTFILLMAISTATLTAQQYSDQYLMAAQKLELRAGPGLNFNVIGEVPQGTQVYVLQSGYGEWSTVQYKRNNGFVKTAHLTSDNRIAEADRAAKEAEAKRAAAQKAAADAIARAEAAKRAAEEAARKAIADAERLKREAEAQAMKASADAAAARRAKQLAAQRVAKDSEETRRALAEAQRRAAQSGSVASAPIESNAPSYGSSSKPSATAKSSVTREDKFLNWEKKTYKSGAVPKSFGKFKGKFDYKLDNYLKVVVGKNTDIVIKIVKMGKTEKDDETVRVAYINSNSTQYIRNLPVGEYYCVIAYGKEWKETIQNGKVKGSFTKNALYEKDPSILNYKTIKLPDGRINVPSYTLNLDLQADGTLGYGSNQEDDISNDQFNSF